MSTSYESGVRPLTLATFAGPQARSLMASLLSVWIVLATLSLAASAQDFRFRHVLVDNDGPVDPWGKAVGDLNGDGAQDLITGGSREGGLVWYENPNWQRHYIQRNGRWSTDHEVVDIDGDGDNDLVSITRDSLVWYANPGFQQVVIEKRVLHDIEIADFDGDGLLDIVGRDQGEFGHSGELLHVYLQISPGQWHHRQIPCPDGEGLAVGDVDHDGDPDVVINSVWFENTRNSDLFQQHAYANNWTHAATFVELADINLDGRTDIILAPSELAGQRYRISWFQGPAVDTAQDHTPWREHIVDPDVEAVHHFVGAADFDRDGLPDIASAEMHQGTDPDEVKIYRQHANGWSKQVIAESGSHSMRIVDIDDDGDMDLYGANHQGRAVDLWINETTRPAARIQSIDRWTYLPIDDARTSRAFGLCWGDADQDGDMDVAAGAYLYKNPGGDLTGHWERTALPGHVDANAILDLDDDGLVDMLAQDLPRLVRLEAIDKQATQFESTILVNQLPPTGHGASQGFAVADLIPGGHPEYILSTGGGIYYVNLAAAMDGQANALTKVTEDAPEEGLAVGDLNRDGWLDIVAWMGVGSGSLKLAWWEHPGSNQPDWKFHALGTVTGVEGDRIEVGDFDQDGWLDVVATGTSNAGSGSSLMCFTNPGNAEVPWSQYVLHDDLAALNSLDVADLNGDHIPDIITGEHRGQKRIVIWQTQPSADLRWHPVEIDQGRESHLGTQLVDLDGNGTLDLLSIGWDEFQFLHLWRNDNEIRQH